MRKKTVNHVADTIFWYLLYFLPVLAYLLFCFAEPSSGGNIVPLVDFFEHSGFMLGQNNLILNTIESIFADGGILPLFNDYYALQFIAWFASIYLVHLMVDFILFIPRLAHKWMNAFTRSE